MARKDFCDLCFERLMLLILSKIDIIIIFWFKVFFKNYVLLAKIILRSIFQNIKLLKLLLAYNNVGLNLIEIERKFYFLKTKPKPKTKNFAIKLIIAIKKLI